MKTKVCTKCGEEKALDEFGKHKRNKDGMRYQCKACRKKYYEANREQKLAKQKAYHEANRDKILAKQKAYREANKEELAAKRKKRYQSNREQELAMMKAYREANKEKIAAKSKAYREANRDKILAKQKAYYEANKEMFATYKKAYQKKRYAEDPVFRTMASLRDKTRRLGDYKSKSTIEIVGISPQEFWERNGSPSVEELEDLHIDHIVPLSWFDLEDEDHVTVSSHWTNFQYLTTEDNLIKNNNYAGRPDAILGYKDNFDIEKHVQDMIEFINATK